MGEKKFMVVMGMEGDNPGDSPGTSVAMRDVESLKKDGVPPDFLVEAMLGEFCVVNPGGGQTPFVVIRIRDNGEIIRTMEGSAQKTVLAEDCKIVEGNLRIIT